MTVIPEAQKRRISQQRKNQRAGDPFILLNLKRVPRNFIVSFASLVSVWELISLKDSFHSRVSAGNFDIIFKGFVKVK